VRILQTLILCVGETKFFFKVEAGCMSSACHITLKGHIVITHLTGGYRCPVFKCLISDGCSLSGALSCAPGKKPLLFFNNLNLSRMSLLGGKKNTVTARCISAG